ncbi:MAG: hypothetical protein KGZ96_13215 [Clostridia bacterium]|jgi:hypothetical protein|nr:hypothetical protein [Clostridia bacterium]
MDEQVKQLYDIWMLMTHYIKDLHLENIKKKYFRRAKLECASRDIPFDLQKIRADILLQLRRISEVDGGQDAELKKYINDFKGLYLNSNISFSPSNVACAAEQIKLMYEAIFNDFTDFSIVVKAFEIEDYLKLSQFEGKEKGEKVKELRNILIEKYASYSTLHPRVLQGKNLNRVYWSVIDIDNITEIEKSVINYLGLSP